MALPRQLPAGISFRSATLGKMTRTGFLVLVATLLSAQPVALRSPITAAQGPVARVAGIAGAAIADFNRDNRPDFVYVTLGLIPTWQVVLGNGDGTFRAATDLAAAFSTKPFAADLNGDGRADLIANCSGSYLSGNGDGTFRNATLVVAGGAPGPAAPLFVADADNDSRPDLLCGNVVFVNGGADGFRRSSTFGDALAPVVLVVADFTRDGRADILFRTDAATLFLARGQGDGSFLSPAAISHPFYLADGIVAADFNGDGSPDLAGLNVTTRELVVLLNSGSGVFSTAARTSLPYSPGTYSPRAAADLNGDRRIDLVVGDFVLLGNGDGTFQFPVPFAGTSDRCVIPLQRSTEECAVVRQLTAIADFNQDGRPDILNGDFVVTPRSGTIGARAVLSVLLNVATASGFTITGVNSASADMGIAPNSIVTAYGTGLAPRTEAAASTDFPTALGGIRLRLDDRRDGESYAPLLFVSPTQINFVNPSAERQVMISIEPVDASLVPPPSGLAYLVTASAPALYNLSGLALGNALTVAPDGTRTSQSLVSCSLGRCDAVPLDVTAGDVIVSLYGTGFDRPDLPSVMCLANGQPLPVLYAGPQLELRGLSQVNLRLPVTIAGAGSVRIGCTFRALPPPPFTEASPAATTNFVRIQVQ